MDAQYDAFRRLDISDLEDLAGAGVEEIQGDLSMVPIPELLRWLSRSRRQGTLACVLGGCRKELFFQRGRLVFASSTRNALRLGQFLVAKGDINARQLARCLELWELQGGRARLSQVIVDVGLLSRELMIERLRQLVDEIVYDIFVHEGGIFTFQPNRVAPQVLSAMRPEKTDVLVQGVWLLHEYRARHGALPGPEQVLIAAPGDRTALPFLGESARAVYEAIGRQSDFKTVLNRVKTSTLDLQVQLIGLMSNSLVTVSTPPRVPTAAEKLEQRIEIGRRLLRDNHLEAAQSVLVDVRLDFERQPPEADALTRVALRLEAFAAQLFGRIINEVEAMAGGGDDTRLEIVNAMLDTEAARKLGAEEGFVLSRVASSASLREMVHASGMPRERAYDVLFSLFRKGIVRRTAPAARAAVPGRKSHSGR
ncbi:MAG: DUF4388 domain-containing protein [Candidatus Schekmanbacteria bacterium]|nr:DUF4388 domain-containing protein [Candidatus Schekmanbacteria bacterium]